MTIPEGSRGEGALTKNQKIVSEEWKRRADRLRRHIVSLSLLRETVRASSRSRDFASTFPDDDMFVSSPRDYSTKYESSGRSYASTSSFQNVTRRLRYAVCDPRAEDWDIKNCMFTLTVQIAHRIQIDLNIAEAKLDEIRQRYRQHVAGLNCIPKQKVISTAHGGAIPICSDPSVKSFFEQVSSAARLLRWLACSVMPSLFDRFLCDPDVHPWPENTCGVLVTRATDELQDSFSTEGQEQIHVDTGYSVTIAQKHHHTFIDGLKLKGIQEHDFRVGHESAGHIKDILFLLLWHIACWRTTK